MFCVASISSIKNIVLLHFQCQPSSCWNYLVLLTPQNFPIVSAPVNARNTRSASADAFSKYNPYWSNFNNTRGHRYCCVFNRVYCSARLPKLKRQYQGGKKLFGLQDTASMHLLLSKSSIYQPPHGCFVQTVTRDCFLCVLGVYILPNSWKIEAEYTPLVCPDANVMINFDEFVFFLTTSSARYLVGRP